MINKIINSAIWLFLFLLPLYYLPLGNTSIEADKQILLLFFSLFTLSLFMIKACAKKSFKIARTDFDGPILFLSLSYLVSAIFIAPEKINALTFPFSLSTVLGSALLYFILTQTKKSFSQSPITPLLISSTLVSLITLAAFLNIIPQIWPLGDSLTTFSFLIPVGVYLVTDLIVIGLTSKSIKPVGIRLIRFILPKILALAAIVGALCLTGYQLATDQKPLILPFSISWAIMMEAYKNFLHFLFGVGPGNFISAYTSGKPIFTNSTPFWNAIVTSSSNTPLHLATEAGIIAGLIFLFLTYKTIKLLQYPNYQYQSNQISMLISLITILILQFLLPPNILLFILTFVFLAISSPKYEGKKTNFRISPFYPAGFIILICLFLIVYQGKIYLADIFFRQAVVSANAQKITDSYKLAQKAIKLHPNSDRYHILSSNLIMAMVVSDISQSQDKEASVSASKINQMIQQSVEHVKHALVLDDLNSQNWAQAANIYRSLIGRFDKAEQFALDALNRQILLDPSSPLPKVTAGGLLMSVGEYKAAEALFTQAVNLKPDWNNTHYNLAYLYMKTSQYQNAITEFQKTLDLTPPDSEDYQKVQQELEEVKKLLQKKTPAETEPKQEESTSSGPIQE